MVNKDVISTPKTKIKKEETYEEETAPPDVKPNVDMNKVNYRSNMTGLVKLMSTTKFTHGQLKCLKRTPFWMMFDALINTKIELSSCMKYDDVIAKIIETYNPASNCFKIGPKSVKLYAHDIKLIFGIDCGSVPMETAYGSKPTFGLIGKKCKDTQRLTSKNIRSLIDDALVGRKKSDNEEVARLISLYACLKLFYSTTGETIGWAYYQHMEHLDKMREYDWAETIKSTLMNSIELHHERPERVTGCVMALMYWLCERTKIVEPTLQNAAPRFLKWNLTKLHKNVKNLSFSSINADEVYIEKLILTDRESTLLPQTIIQDGENQKDATHSIIHHEVKTEEEMDMSIQDDDIDEAFDTDFGNETEFQSNEHDEANIQEGAETLAYLHAHGVHQVVVSKVAQDNIIAKMVADHKKALDLIEKLQIENQNLQATNDMKDKIILELETLICNQKENPTVQNELSPLKHTIHNKNAEIERQTNSIIDLQIEKTILQLEKTMLEDKIDDDAVHAVTQQINQETMDVEVKQNLKKKTQKTPTSLVKRIKIKKRKELKLPDFQYQEKKGDKQKRKFENLEQNDIEKQCEIVDPDFEGYLHKLRDIKRPKHNKLRLSNKYQVWKIISEQDKQKIKNMHKNGGYGLTVWRGSTKQTYVFYDDLESIIQDKSITNNVIDAYAEILTRKQESMMTDSQQFDRSFFFNSLCLRMIKDEKPELQTKFIDPHIKQASQYRYLHFPLHFKYHWTIVVSDMEDGVWKHYNSMRPRDGSEDIHLAQANIVKAYIESHIQKLLSTSDMADTLTPSDYLKPLQSVHACPQQDPNSLNCGVALCYIMRQHALHEPIEPVLDKEAWLAMRALLVEAFLNDPERTNHPSFVVDTNEDASQN